MKYLLPLLGAMPFLVGTGFALFLLHRGVIQHNDATITHALLLMLILTTADIGHELRKRNRP